MDIFQEKGGGPDQNPNFLRKFCLLDMGLKKKFLKHVQRYRGGQGSSSKIQSWADFLTLLLPLPIQFVLTNFKIKLHRISFDMLWKQHLYVSLRELPLFKTSLLKRDHYKKFGRRHQERNRFCELEENIFPVSKTWCQ